MITRLRHPVTVALAAFAWLALAVQGWVTINAALRAGDPLLHALTDYFLYFTTLTNGFCALILTLRAGSPDDGDRKAFFLRNGSATSATVSILIVMVLYHLLLRERADPEGLQFSMDVVLNYVIPVGFTLYWWESVPRGALALRDLPRWLSYPIGYAFYVLIRGAVVGRYQYYFVDAGVLGLPIAVRNAALVTAVFFAIAVILVLVNRFAGRAVELEP